jgi:hypothetical protein
MIRKNTFTVYKTTDLSANPDYRMDGSSGEGISWRNIAGGSPVRDIQLTSINDDMTSLVSPEVAEVGFNIPAAGLYNVQITQDSYDDFIAYRDAHSLEEANTESPVRVLITSGSRFNKPSPSVDSQEVAVDVLEEGWQSHIIPGLKIRLRPLEGLAGGHRFQVSVGGRWLEEEDRNLEDLFMGGRSANGPTGEAVSITVKNESGVALQSVQAKIVNKISVYQPQQQLDAESALSTVYLASPYWYDDGIHEPGMRAYTVNPYIPYGTNQPFETHPMDLIVPTAGPNWRGEWIINILYLRNDGVSHNGAYYICKTSHQSLGSTAEPGVGGSWQVYWKLRDSQMIHDNPQIKTYSPSIGTMGDYTPNPFWRDRIFYVRSNWTGVGEPTQYTNTGRPINPWYSFLRYDFGPGNFVMANILGLSGNRGDYVPTLAKISLWGSQDDFDIPENWDILIEDVEMGSAPTQPYGQPGVSEGGYIIYNAFPNEKAYRHYAILQEKSLWLLGMDYTHGWSQPAIYVMELMHVPTTTYVVDRSRPFVLLDQSGLTNPAYEADSYPKEMKLEIGDDNGNVNLLVEGEGLDVVDMYTGETKKGGILLVPDGVTRYLFPEYTPYAGLSFVISSDIVTTDRAKLYVTNGADAFDLRLEEDGTWQTSGAIIDVADEMQDSDEFDLYIRPNPASNGSFVMNEATEGLIQIVGNEERGFAVFSDKILTDNLNSYSSLRLVIPAFITKGTKVRFKFWAIAPDGNYIQNIEDVYFGRRKIDATFEPGKVAMRFDGETQYIGTESTWTDWTEFEYDGSYEHLLSLHGGRGWGQTETTFSFYKTSSGDIKTSSGDYASPASLNEGICAVTDMEVMRVDQHVTSIPLSAVISRKMPELTISATPIDEATAAILAEFGITSGEMS